MTPAITLKAMLPDEREVATAAESQHCWLTADPSTQIGTRRIQTFDTRNQAHQKPFSQIISGPKNPGRSTTPEKQGSAGRIQTDKIVDADYAVPGPALPAQPSRLWPDRREGFEACGPAYDRRPATARDSREHSTTCRRRDLHASCRCSGSA